MSNKKVLSAGFLIRSKDKFLLCHATKKKDDKPKQFDKSWTMSKGLVEEGELPIEAAIRELKEETNIDLLIHPFNQLLPQPITDIKVRSSKEVLVFLLEDPEGILMQPSVELKCQSLIDNPDPKLKHLFGLPEMDAFMFVSYEEAKDMVMPSQKLLFDGHIERKLKSFGKTWMYQPDSQAASNLTQPQTDVSTKSNDNNG